MLRDFVVVAAVVRTMITMRKSTHGFPFLSYICMGLRFGQPELRSKIKILCKNSSYLTKARNSTQQQESASYVCKYKIGWSNSVLVETEIY